MGKSAIRPKVEILHLSTVSEGRQLELNSFFCNISHALAAIIADDADESLWFEVYVGDQAVQLPLEIVREALALAHEHVHSEAWYQQQGAYDPGPNAAARALAKREPGHGT